MKNLDSNYFYSICYFDKFGNLNHIGKFFKSYRDAMKYKESVERAVIVKVRFSIDYDF